MASDSADHLSGKRERSARYPGATLEEAIEFCRQIDDLGVDGLSAAQIATAMGYRNVKTNTFSGRLSSARQFGLIDLSDQSHHLTQLAKRIIHPMDPEEIPILLRQACQSPPLFAELLRQYSGKKLPEPEILGNLLMHKHQITASAKSAAAESFFASARFAGILNENRQLVALSDEPFMIVSDQGFSSKNQRVNANPTGHFPARDQPARSHLSSPSRGIREERRRPADEVRLDLALWDSDEGKHLRLRAPASISRESYDRFLQAFQLAVRISDTPVAEIDKVED